MNVSVVVPIHNEENSVNSLLNSLAHALSQARCGAEIILVNDGSTDRTAEMLGQSSGRDGVRVITLHPQQGKTAAWQAGFEAASNEYVATIDSDLENDPADIPKLFEKVLEGFDVVSGWRKERWLERPLSRRLPSIAASVIISSLSGVKLHDYGCGLKIFRTSLLKGLKLETGDHRVLPALLACAPARIAEVEVSWRPRRYGHTKYGLGRIWPVLFSLVRVYRFRRIRHAAGQAADH